MDTKFYPIDKIFDKTGNKYLSTVIIMTRAREKSERNQLLASEMNKSVDNKMTIYESIKEFLSDELEYTL